MRVANGSENNLNLVFTALLALVIQSSFHFQRVEADVNYDRAALQELTQFPQQHRYAEGRLCAAAFEQQGKIYTDCTDAPTPDGQSGREWCYYTEQLIREGEKNWGYCSPVIDYNLIRAKANEAFTAKSVEVQKIVMRLDTERSRLEDILVRYNATCGSKKDSVAARLKKAQALVDKAERALQKIRDTVTKIGTIQSSVASLSEEIEQQRTAALHAPENCAMVPGYEDDPFPDGLRGSYFKNPTFRGAPQYRVDEQLDFRWSAKDPLPGIPYQGFSVRWEGFVQAPYTADYTFFTETDCGARLFINGEPIIVDRMPSPTTPVEKSLPASPLEVPLLPPSEHDGVKTVASVPISLNAGDKNSIRVEMIHSSHLRWKNPDDASFKLMWKSPGIHQEIVPRTAFYQANRKPPLKVSGLDPNDFELTFLYDGEYAYKGSKRHFLADIPFRFYGSKTIRGSLAPTATKLGFEVNSIATLYIAAPTPEVVGGNPPFTPCEGTLKETSDILSVYEGASRQERATNAVHFTLYETEIATPGYFNLDLLRPGLPFIAFLRPRRDSGEACGGKTIVVSDPESPAYESCEASSVLSPEYACQYGLGNIQADQRYGAWKSSGGNGVGEFIVVRFKRPVQLKEMRFTPLNDAFASPSEITLSFSEAAKEGYTKKFTIMHASNLFAMRYPLNSIITRYVKLEVSGMYVNGGDTGGSFQLLGTICQENAPGTNEKENPSTTPLEALEQGGAVASTSDTSLITIEQCSQSILDLGQAHPIVAGKRLQLACPQTCLDAPANTAAETRGESALFAVAQVSVDLRDAVNDGKAAPESFEAGRGQVYGSDIYAPESTICYAAIHAGVCGPMASGSASESGLCIFTATFVPSGEHFQGQLRNGIKSEDHGSAEIAVSFAAQPKRLGMGTKEEVMPSYRIAFRSADLGAELPKGYRIDDGSIFSNKDPVSTMAFGWERAAHPVKCGSVFTGERGNPLNIGGVEFPPDPSSTACSSEMADCNPNAWKLQLPSAGLYHVEVQVGNPCHPTEGARQQYLQINGNPIISGVELPKGQYHWASEEVAVGTERMLTLTAHCEAENVSEDGTPSPCSSAQTTLMNLKVVKQRPKRLPKAHEPES